MPKNRTKIQVSFNFIMVSLAVFLLSLLTHASTHGAQNFQDLFYTTTLIICVYFIILSNIIRRASYFCKKLSSLYFIKIFTGAAVQEKFYC